VIKTSSEATNYIKKQNLYTQKEQFIFNITVLETKSDKSILLYSTYADFISITKSLYEIIAEFIMKKINYEKIIKKEIIVFDDSGNYAWVSPQ